ncbi:hypothetical protein HPB50_022180 [Hyalomma asiaticum]|uniref:Uncharacterized protein n=1 Tax=Hyalomma asiaticum TaxID=266040 RepID=A0ACB7SH89_HYAAI|nr:hypothetical protein HPB50_022180 [Hyalomma asiaticum]
MPSANSHLLVRKHTSALRGHLRIERIHSYRCFRVKIVIKMQSRFRYSSPTFRKGLDRALFAGRPDAGALTGSQWAHLYSRMAQATGKSETSPPTLVHLPLL